MIKPFLIFVSLLPLSLFSQDTLFNQRLSEITVKSVAKKERSIPLKISLGYLLVKQQQQKLKMK